MEGEHEILEVLQEALRGFHASSGTIAVLCGERFQVVASVGLWPGRIRKGFSAKRGVAAAVLREKCAVQIDGKGTLPGHAPFPRGREPYALCLPLLTGSGEIFGFLSLNRKDRAFNSEEVVSAQLLAWEVAFRLGESGVASVPELERGLLVFLGGLSEDVASILRRTVVAAFAATRAPLLVLLVPPFSEVPLVFSPWGDALLASWEENQSALFPAVREAWQRKHPLFMEPGEEPQGLRHSLRLAAIYPVVSGQRVLGVMVLFLEKPLAEKVKAALALLFGLSGVLVENRLLSEAAETAACRQERLRIAQEIHNTLTQDLAGVELYLEVLRRKLSSGKMERRNVTAILERVGAAVHRCLLQSRDVLRTLWESVEERKGFVETLVQALERRLALGTQRIHHRVTMRIPEYLVPPGIRELFLQVTAEALNNALKYAQARNVVVKIGLSQGRVYLLFHDDGQGMEETRESKYGHGLDLLREQVLLQKGVLRVRSGRGRGTTVKVMVPLYGR